MKTFRVVFELVNGEKKTYENYNAQTYNHAVAEVMENKAGWFGSEGEFVNLSNVLYCKITEVDDNGNAL